MLISKLCNGFIAQSRVALPSLRPKIKLLKRIPCSNLNIARFSSISYLDVKTGNKKLEFGHYDTIASAGVSARQFTEVKNIGDDSNNGPADGEKVWVRGRIHSIRSKGNAIFAVIRSDAFYTIQICHFKDKSDPEHSKQLMKFIDSIPLESVVDVYGEVASAIVKSCSQTSKEIAIEKIFIISKALSVLPFQLEDASRPQHEIVESQSTSRPFSHVEQDVRLNNRWLDLRVPANNAIMRVKSGFIQLFREGLLMEDFVEINTPKLISGESEGGADVFRTDYFGQPACLAQSPQLYKQMAISSDLNRVFEIGPVFRAENSKTRRHLCEFVGLDIEMVIREHYNEVLNVLHRVFKYMFNNIEIKFKKELEVIRMQYPSSPITFTDDPLIIHWEDAMNLLTKHLNPSEKIDVMADLSTPNEIKLGKLIKDKYGTDFYMLDQYPSTVRPFYTMSNPRNPLYSNSYDIFVRGEEICSGAQRCHDAEMLLKQIQNKNITISASLEMYINSFRHGTYPHGGAGIGLDRLVFLYLGLDTVKKASMFPRDPGRCVP